MKIPLCRSASLLSFLFFALQIQAVPQANQSQTDHKLRIVRATDNRFASLASEHFAIVAANPNYSSIIPLSVVVQNNTALQVRAFAVRWIATYPSGEQETLYKVGFPEPTTAGMPGSGIVIAPGQMVLANPFFEINSDQSVAGSSLPPLSSDDISVIKRLKEAQAVSVVLDSAIFGNRIIIGKDTYGLKSRFTCEHNAVVEEAISLRALSSGTDILNLLSRDALSANMPDSAQACTAARGRAAIRLLTLYRQSETGAFQLAIQRLSTAPEINLMPLNQER